MSEKVHIQYELGQHGWSSFRLDIGEASVVVGPFGYCTDALGDIVRGALIIATSGSRAVVSLDAEPMEWRLIAERWGSNQSSQMNFRVRVLTFQGLFNPPAPDAEGNCLFEAQCSAENFVYAVLEAAQAVWDEHGADGYDRAWGGPSGFPLRALHALRAAISVREHRTGWLGSNS